MELSTRKPSLSGLARRIVIDKLFEEEKVLQALEKAKELNMPFVNYLIDNKLVDPKQLAFTAAVNFGLPLFDISQLNFDFIPKEIVRPDIIQKHNVMPIYKNGDHLYIAMTDPTNQSAIDEIKFYTGLHTCPVLVEANLLTKLISEIQSIQESAVLNELEDSSLEDLDVKTEEELEGDAIAVEANDAPIIRFVHKMLLEGINKGASDIHFECYEKKYRVRMRLDGILYQIASAPVTLATRIAARIKVMSRLDISERRIPQDGRFKINLSANRAIDFRVSTCPTVNGEKVVVRILDPSSASLGVDSLGFEPFQKDQFLKVPHQPQGMILVTGPTGSGKTLTLYTALNILNTENNNLSTVEDPVEIHVSGINQVNINLKTGLTFATALRSFLRQDPDIIMVGEMRDLETAEIGVKAAQTGHLVLSTLHTNSAPETLTRLANMGLPLYNIATSVSMIVAQRLARLLCPHCKLAENIPKAVLLKEGFNKEKRRSLQIYGPNAEGCDHCTNGYKGRIGIFEMLPITEAVSAAILANANSLELFNLAKKEGMITLREAGILKVQQGLTSLEEINRITKD